jgi:hypothetical protein
VSRAPKLIKQYHDNSHWPYVLETPNDDMSFWPFRTEGCLYYLVFIPALFGLTAAGLAVMIWVLQMIGVVSS